MNRELLCTWLGLADKCWPPDPYQLLGVPPGEKDSARIEQNVHERLCRLRGYQVAHPEEATEGMNCLARAFIQVTDSLPRAKSPTVTATATLPTGNPCLTASEAKSRDAVSAAAVPGGKAEADWHVAPPPIRGPAAKTTHDTALVAASSLAETVSEAQPLKMPAGLSLDSASLPAGTTSAETACALARNCSEARKGLSTLPGLLGRVIHTRSLCIAWKHVGKYFRDPRRQLTKSAEEAGLARRLDMLFEVMEDYPAFIGHPGKPGYRVVAMARLEKTAHMFRGLDTHQREELARDWEAGEKVLREHRRFLLERIKAMKRRDWADKCLSALGSFARDHFVWVGLGSLVLLGLLVFWISR